MGRDVLHDGPGPVAEAAEGLEGFGGPDGAAR